MRINFFGDFLAPDIDGLRFSDDVTGLIGSADANVINFEAPVKVSADGCTTPPKSGPVLMQDASGPSFLESVGFNMVSLANNHMMDYGVKGLTDTQRAFKRAQTFGAGTWEEAYRPCAFSCANQTVAILGAAHYEFGMLADRWDKRYGAGVAWINHPDFDRIVVETRKQVDYLIVFAHAGVEHLEQPLPEWRDRYRSLIDLGCDAVIASHPHTVQGWEVWHGKPIAYSLGNFYFPKNVQKPRQWYGSLCASLTLEHGTAKMEMTPLVFSDNFVEVDKSSGTADIISQINKRLGDDKAYMDYVNQKSLDMLKSYDGSFAASGYLRISDMGGVKRTLKRVVKMLLGYKYPSVHLENNLRCESHRWCISRGIKMRDDYQ